MTNIKRSVLLLGIIAAGMLLYISCNETIETPPIDPEITYDLEQVEGTQGADMTLNQGSAVGRDSWFEVELSGIDYNGIISNGATEGWCVEWDKNIAQNAATHNGVQIYSTLGKERWKPLNHLLTIKDRLKQEDPDLTYREIQAAIWSVADGSDFDVDMPASEMPPRLTKDGQPAFDKQKVKAIVNDVQANATSHKYKTGGKHAVFIHSSEDQQTVTVPSQETVSHGFVEGVTPSDDPRFAERTYPVVQADWEGPGGDKKWTGMNLGATEEPTAIDDTRPETNGWYFQYDRKQGHFHDGTIGTASTIHWEDIRSESSVWRSENDPCTQLLGEKWRIPTHEEWISFHESAPMVTTTVPPRGPESDSTEIEIPDRNHPYESVLKLHWGEYISAGIIPAGGPRGKYWSSEEGTSEITAWHIGFSDNLYTAGLTGIKSLGMTIRCIED